MSCSNVSDVTGAGTWLAMGVADVTNDSHHYLQLWSMVLISTLVYCGSRC